MTMPLSTKWRTLISSYLALVLITVVTFSTYSKAQNFDPILDDKVYLNYIEKQIGNEVNTTRVIFLKQAQILDAIARQFVAAQLKENLFIALRVLAEKELAGLSENGTELLEDKTEPAEASSTVLYTEQSLESEISSTTAPSATLQSSYIRRKRQDDGDDDGDDGDAAAAAAGAAGAPLRPTIPPQIGLLPQVANLVKVIFGGNGQVNFTSYVASASKLLPRPVGNQVLSIVKILTNNQNNRNSFTTANPLTAGQLPANLDLKSPAFAGLTPEQLLALGLPANLEGLTPEALNSLAGLAGIAAAGTPGGAQAGAAGGATGFPGGLTAQDIAYLQALGISDLPNLGPTPPPAPPRSTRKPRPSYAPQNNNNNNNKNTQQQQQQQIQNEQQQLLNLQQQQLLQNQQLHLQQQQLQQPPSYNQQQFQEHGFIAPTYAPNYVNGPPNYGQNPQFAAAEKDILPLNLNPNKQTLTEIQYQLLQQLQAQQSPKYQETPQSAAQPTLFAPDNNNFAAANNLAPANNNNFKPVGGSSQQQSNFYNPQSNVGGSISQQQNLQQQQLASQNNFISGGTPEQDVHTVGDISPIQPAKPQKSPSSTGGKNRRPQTPFQQQQALLQAQQLQQLQQLQQQEPNQQKPERPLQQIAETQLQQQQQEPLQAERPQKVPEQSSQFQQQSQFIQQQQQQQQQPPQSQFVQNPAFQGQPQQQQPPQTQLFQQQPQPPIQPQAPFLQPQSQFQQQQQQPQNQFQQNQLQQKYQQQLFRPRPPLQNSIDEDESEEADTDYDTVVRKKRQFNILQTLLPSLLRPNNNNNNNNNNQNNNNNNNGQQQQPPQNSNNNNNSTGNNNNNTTNNPSNNNNNNNNSNQNNGFDLNMFAMNLSRGIGDVVRVMPDLFRGAREGLQLIQALSSILRAFPGLADALPIL